jgi:hypothetical protein
MANGNPVKEALQQLTTLVEGASDPATKSLLQAIQLQTTVLSARMQQTNVTLARIAESLEGGEAKKAA